RLREEPQARPGWVVARRGDEKQLLTPFGMVSYGRTYFRHRAGKQYASLADAVIGVTPHQRVNDGVKARLVERAVEQSYRKSGRWAAEEAWHVSAQTVMAALRQTRVPRLAKSPGHEAASEVSVRRGGRRPCAQSAGRTLAAAVGVRA